ncbi:unnamed protein product [Rotaria magnacalcarata]|uniref:Uncharacterized protein n=1 Tax=Rotaria magnacalcarata TaxID=392030 RepID=A0A8S3B6Z4_9BILA|nr:unnamed protein product [Rotaria magnacalcarata]
MRSSYPHCSIKGKFKRFINQTKRLMVNSNVELTRLYDQKFKRSGNHSLGSKIYTFILLKYMSCNLEVHHITRYE